MELDLNRVEDIELELTTLCNASCPLCYRNYKVFKEHYPKRIIRNIIDIKNDIDKFPNLKYIKLVGSISEPTLYPNFLELIHYIKSKKLEIEICTNGDTNNQNNGYWWKELGKLLSLNDQVFFSICGSTQELHEVYRKGTKLNNILRNAKRLRNEKPIDFAQCIRFQYNDEDFNSDQFKELIKEFTNIYWTETYLRKPNENYLKPDNLNLLYPLLSKKDKYLKVENLATRIFQQKKIETSCGNSMKCMAYENKSLQIDINGNIYPCYLFLEASNGNKWDKNWSKILNGNYEVCKFCHKNIKAITEKEMHYII
jgi:MoaA/NifB/PqqE/SkfB family radical SAM enzyme